MSLKIQSFGGRLGFEARRLGFRWTSDAYLKYRTIMTSQSLKKYIDEFMSKKNNIPLLVNIETINRCNGHCSFCPCNVHDEKRVFKYMQDELFEKIIYDLQSLKYAGILTLHVNNEPFMDRKMPERLLFAKKHIPDAFFLLYSNGTLISNDILYKINGVVDRLIINNYNYNYALNATTKKIVDIVNKNYDFHMEIIIQRRYVQEVLSNRAGSAPNKSEAKKCYKSLCAMPFTDLTVFPDGTVGLCCSDALEKTDFGNLSEKTILDIFNSKKLQEVRQRIQNGRNQYEFCKHCDFIDAGIRDETIKRFNYN